MPRQIIDTESGRPRYRRRVAITVLTVVLLTAVLVALILVFAPGKSPAAVYGGAVSLQENACCDA